MENNVIINLVGPPCAGKSTAAAGLYYKLKVNGIRAEMAREFCKDAVYRNCMTDILDTVYSHGEMYHRVNVLTQSPDVDIVITDSPTILAAVYCDTADADITVPFIAQLYKRMNNLTYVLPSCNAEDYDDKGRIHSASDSMFIQDRLFSMLSVYGIPYINIPKDCDVVEYIYADLVKRGIIEDKK